MIRSHHYQQSIVTFPPQVHHSERCIKARTRRIEGVHVLNPSVHCLKDSCQVIPKTRVMNTERRDVADDKLPFLPAVMVIGSVHLFMASTLRSVCNRCLV